MNTLVRHSRTAGGFINSELRRGAPAGFARGRGRILSETEWYTAQDKKRCPPLPLASSLSSCGRLFLHRTRQNNKTETINKCDTAIFHTAARKLAQFLRTASFYIAHGRTIKRKQLTNAIPPYSTLSLASSLSSCGRLFYIAHIRDFRCGKLLCTSISYSFFNFILHFISFCVTI